MGTNSGPHTGGHRAHWHRRAGQGLPRTGAVLLSALLSGAPAAEPAIPANPLDGLPLRTNERFADPCELGRALRDAELALGGIGMTEPERLAAITAIGNDQRYYLYVRSWLQLEQFALAATRDAHERSGLGTAELDEQLAFFSKAIRALDLE